MRRNRTVCFTQFFGTAMSGTQTFHKVVWQHVGCLRMTQLQTYH